jgi:hypothetical protein
MKYNQTNYVYWGTIYLNRMQQLKDLGKHKFKTAKFASKLSKVCFNEA